MALNLQREFDCIEFESRMECLVPVVLRAFSSGVGLGRRWTAVEVTKCNENAARLSSTWTHNTLLTQERIDLSIKSVGKAQPPTLIERWYLNLRGALLFSPIVMYD